MSSANRLASQRKPLLADTYKETAQLVVAAKIAQAELWAEQQVEMLLLLLEKRD